jgi:hypothetical protein
MPSNSSFEPYVTTIAPVGEDEARREEIINSILLVVETRDGMAREGIVNALDTVRDLDQLRRIQAAALRESKTIDELQAMARDMSRREQTPRRAAVLEVTLKFALEVLQMEFGTAGVDFALDLVAVTDLDKLHEIVEAAVRGSKTLDQLRAMVPQQFRMRVGNEINHRPTANPYIITINQETHS